MVSASLRVGSEAISESKFGRNESGAHHVVGAGELGDRVSQYAGPELAHGVIGAEQVGRPRAGAHTAEHLTAHRKMKVPSLDSRRSSVKLKKFAIPTLRRATHQRFTLASWSAAASSASTPSSPLSAPPSPSLFAAFFRKSLKHFLSCAQNLSTSASVVPSAAAAVK